MFVIYNNCMEKFIGTEADIFDENLTSNLMNAKFFKHEKDAEEYRMEILSSPGYHPTYSILEWK